MKTPATGHDRLPDRSRTKVLYDQQLPVYKASLQQLAQDVRLILEPQGLTPAIKYRIKSFQAYFDKLRKQNKFNDSRRMVTINDFFGLRIICPFLEDIETVSNLLVTHFEVLDTECKANQHSFREFGYDSVHLTLRMEATQTGRSMPGVRKVCEVQLRTILQDAWAEVEHELVYKSDISLPNQSIRRKLASRKRRASVEREALDQEFIAISHPTTTEPPARIGPIPSTMASHLEKTMLRALKAHSNHDLENAIALYGQLLGMQLDRKMRGLVYNHRGMAYFAIGSHQRALKDFSSAISYDPEGDRGYANRGLCYRVMKKYEKALKDFDQALIINPNRPDSYFGRAQTHYDMQQFELALADCEKALLIHSGYQPARELIKALYRQQT
jgi:putative GTP pyrophosphokinase